MANIENDDFGDFNFSDFDDDGMGGFSTEPPKDDRKASAKILGGFVEGVKDNLLNPSTHNRVIRGVLPEGYRHTLDLADSAFSSANELVDEAKKAAKPVIKELKRGTRLILPKVDPILPKGLSARLTQWSKEEESKGVKKLTEEEIEANAVAIELGGIFNSHFEAQKKREQERDAQQQLKDIVQIKTASNSNTLLDDISKSSRRLAEYQDQVTANYQRKSLELQFKHYFVSRRLLNTMEKHLGFTEAGFRDLVKNSALPDIIKYRNMEKMHDILKEQMYGRVTEPMGQWFRGIGQRIVKKAKGEINTFFSDIGAHINDRVTSAEGMREEMQSGFDMMRDIGGEDAVRDMKLNMGGSMLGGAASTYVINKLINPLKEKIAANGFMNDSNYTLMRKIEDAPALIRQWVRSGGQGEPPLGLEFLGKGTDLLRGAIGGNYKENLVQKSGLDQLDEMANLRNKTIRSLEEVIPGWLSKIHHQVKITASGDKNAEQEVFNFETSQFETVGSIKKTMKEKIAGGRQKAAVEVYSSQLMKQIDPSGTLSPGATKALKLYLIKLAYKGDHFDPGLLVNERKFPSAISSDFKDEIMTHFKDKYGFDDSTQYDENDNFVGEPFKREGGGYQEQLYHLSKSFGNLSKYIPDAMEEALKQAKMGRIDLMEQEGYVKRNSDGTSYDLDRDKILEMILTPEKKKKTGYAAGGLFTDTNLQSFAKGGMKTRRNRRNRRGGSVKAPGSGANDTANAELANREYVVNARSTSIPGVLPLVRYLNGLGNMEDAAINTAQEGLDSSSAIEQSIHKFHEDSSIKGDRIIELVEEISGKLDSFTSIGLNLHGLGDIAKTMGGKISVGYDSLKLKGKGITDQVEKKLKDMEIEKLFENGLIEAKELEKALKGKLDSKELKAVLKAYEARRKEILKELAGKGAVVGSAAGNAAKAVWGAKGNAFSWLREKGSKVTGLIGTGFSWAGSKAYLKSTTAYENFKDSLSDVWIEGETKPRLTAALLRSGAYIDVNTGKVVKNFKDITGELRDQSGNIVISFDEFKNKMVDPYGRTVLEYMTKKAKAAANIVLKPATFIREKAGKIGKFIMDAFDGPADVYIKGEPLDKPRLYSVLMTQGRYRNKHDGSPITKVSDIKGEVEEVNGEEVKIVISLDDWKKGLVNNKGEPFLSLKGIGREIARRAVGFGMAAGKRILDTAKMGFNKLVSFLNKGGARLKGFVGSFSDTLSISLFATTKDVVAKLDDIYKLLDSKFNKRKNKKPGTPEEATPEESTNPKESTNPEEQANQGTETPPGEEPKKSIGQRVKDKVKGIKDKIKEKVTGKPPVAGDADGDGDRDNSAEDRRERKEKEGKEKEEKSRWQKMLDALGNKGRNKEDGGSSLLGGLVSKITPLITGAVTLISTVGSAAGTVVGLLGKVIGFVGKMGWGATKGVAKAGWAVTKGLFKVGKWGVTRALPWVARAAVGVLSGPVGWGLMAGAAAYYGYKYFTRDNIPLTKFRMAQYGYKSSDEEHASKIMTLEAECLKLVKVSPGQFAKLGSGKSIEDLCKIFGVDITNEEDLQKWIAWFQYRFKPIFLGSVTQLFKLKGKTDLHNIDKLLLTGQKREFIRYVNTLQVEQNPYKINVSPFAGEEKVELDEEDVQDAYKDASSEIDDNESKNDKEVENSSGTKPKEEKGWWETLKEGATGAAAGAAALVSKAWNGTKNIVSSAVNATGRGLAAAGSGIVAAGSAISSGASNLYNGAVDAASAGMEKVAKTFEVKSPLKGPRKDNFMSVYRAAEQAGDPHPAIVAAQWALESGWGEKESGKFNYFGIKARKNEPGTVRRTREVLNGKDVWMDDKFADYPSLEAGIQGRVDFINNNPGYRKAGYFEAKTPYEAAMALVRGKYATDPKYATLLGKIMAGMGIDPSKPSGTGIKALGAAIGSGISNLYNGAVDAASAGMEKLANNYQQGEALKMAANPKRNMVMVYNAFIKAGFTPTQAKALTAEVGRENGYNPSFLYGTHEDAANAATNIGFFSWQGGRKKELVKYMAGLGLADSDGKFKIGQESLDAQAMFAKKELFSGQYKVAQDALTNPNLSAEELARPLGKGYIKWAYGQDVLKNGTNFDWRKHDNKRRGYLLALEKEVGKETIKPSQPTSASEAVASTTPTGGNAANKTTAVSEKVASTTPSGGAAFIPYKSAANKTTAPIANNTPAPAPAPVAASPMVETVSFTPPSKENKQAKAEAAAAASANKEKQVNKELNMEMGRIAMQQLAAAERSANTLDSIHETLKRMEELGMRKPVAPQATIPNGYNASRATERGAPVDITRTF